MLENGAPHHRTQGAPDNYSKTSWVANSQASSVGESDDITKNKHTMRSNFPPIPNKNTHTLDASLFSLAGEWGGGRVKMVFEFFEDYAHV